MLAWSSGKDSAWALHVLRQQGIAVSALLTTLNEQFDRVAMHGVRRELLDAQAESIGIPLWTVAFGDLFLRDIRAYRERQLAGSGLTPIFPIWELPTIQLARDMIAGGVRARLACIDPKSLDRSFAGREFDSALLADLPATVDACGENGEFHTFAYDGPIFRAPISISAGAIHESSGFVYADLVPAACPV
jgi:diphthamide synthase (EF-2-diphthine--ammonia ligase)